MEILLSILIPTLRERQPLFDALAAKLQTQIESAGLTNAVEILSLADEGELTIGRKRNLLMQRAAGRFTVFVDDDDLVSESYVPLICGAIDGSTDIDCIGFRGTITFDGRRPRQFVHSIRYTRYLTQDGVYTRPPYHLNPIRRQIALRYPFAEVNYSEDVDWAMRLCRDRVLKRETFIEPVLYYYRCRTKWWYQAAVDLTEPVRRILGLELANRLRVQRWIQSKVFRRPGEMAKEPAV